MSVNRSQRRKVLHDLNKRNSLSSKPIEAIIFYLKYVLSDHQVAQLLPSLTAKQRQLITPNHLPKNYNEIRKKGMTYSNNDLVKEIRWYVKDFIIFSSHINKFIDYEKVFEKNFLLGDYESAKYVLDKIETEICVSEWSIEKKLLIAEYQKGFKTNKELLAAIVSGDNDPVTNALAQHGSTRIEKNISASKYQEFARKFISYHKSDDLNQCLAFKLNFFAAKTYSNKGYILNFDSSSTIIDRYKSFTVVLASFISENDRRPSLDDDVADILTLLLGKLNDPTITKLLYSLNREPEIAYDSATADVLMALDAYTNADFFRAKELCTELLRENPDLFELYDVYIKSVINLHEQVDNIFPENSLSYQILSSLIHIVKKDSKTYEALLNSINVYSSIASFPWAYNYHCFVRNEFSVYDNIYEPFRMSNILTKYHNPIFGVFFFIRNSGQNYLINLGKIYTESDSIKFWLDFNGAILDDTITDIPEWKTKSYRSILYYSKFLQFKNLYAQSLNELVNLQTNERFRSENAVMHNIEEIIFSKLMAYLHLKDYPSAIDLVASSNIDNVNLANRLSYSILIDKILAFDDPQINSNINSSILLHQYEVETNDLWIAYDNFLTSIGVNFPHEIRETSQNFNHKNLIYFLHYLCKQEIYYSSYYFNNQNELDNERIEVCLLLADIDDANQEEYFREISDISRSLLIRQGIKQIDESKIYVDVKGVKTSLEKDLKESFNRSLNLSSVPIDQLQKIVEKTGNVLIPYLSKDDSQKNDFNSDNIKLTSYSRFEIFADMFDKIRDKFIASNEFGIDTYLSVRIRHGTLSGEIRSPFEAENIVTKKDSETGKYLTNDYWLSKFQFANPSLEKDFNSLMAEFSNKIDVISDELKNIFLQVKTEKKKTDGLFDYSYTESELLKAFKIKYVHIEDYDEFFSEVIDNLWEKTESNLNNVRAHIANNIKSNIITWLRELQENLDAIIDKTIYPTLSELIHRITFCQTSINIPFDKISQWFQRTNNKTINDFDFQLPLEASIITIKRIFRNYSKVFPEISNGSTTIFDGEYFAQFTDIVQILLHNIIIHSHLPADDLNIKIKIYETKNILNIIIQNNINARENLDYVNDNIKKTRDLLEKSHDNEITRKEGGSGYLKVKKILKSDLLRNEIIITLSNVDESYIFQSHISFEINNLEKQKV
jgi:hypothetical protein